VLATARRHRRHDREGAQGLVVARPRGLLSATQTEAISPGSQGPTVSQDLTNHDFRLSLHQLSQARSDPSQGPLACSQCGLSAVEQGHGSSEAVAAIKHGVVPEPRRLRQHLANAARGPAGCLRHGVHVVELAGDQFATAADHQNGSSIVAGESEAYNRQMPSSRATRRRSIRTCLVTQGIPCPMGGPS